MEVGHPIGDGGKQEPDGDDQLDDMEACSMDEWRPDQAACRARKNAADKEYWVDLHAELQQEDDRFQNRSDGEAHQDRRWDQAIGGQPPKLEPRRRRRKTANAKRVK